jgi:hypothetical protein
VERVSLSPAAGEAEATVSGRGVMDGQGQNEPFMHGSIHTSPSGQKNPGQHVLAFHRSTPKKPGEQLGLDRPYLCALAG